jgi:hypothetical protein
MTLPRSTTIETLPVVASGMPNEEAVYPKAVAQFAPLSPSVNSVFELSG